MNKRLEHRRIEMRRSNTKLKQEEKPTAIPPVYGAGLEVDAQSGLAGTIAFIFGGLWAGELPASEETDRKKAALGAARSESLKRRPYILNSPTGRVLLDEPVVEGGQVPEEVHGLKKPELTQIVTEQCLENLAQAHHILFQACQMKVSQSTQRLERISSLLKGISFSVPVLAGLIATWHLKSGWDDGAITAAFARTFAATGRIALTSHSLPVERTSSIFWMLLLAIPGWLGLGSTAILVWMKVASAAAFLLSLLVFERLTRQFLTDRVLRAVAQGVFAFSITPFRETLNGMEMNLGMLLVLALVTVLWKQEGTILDIIVVSVCGMVLMATRFEAPYFIVVLAVSLVVAGLASRLVWVMVSSSLAAFAALEGVRHRLFHVWMPNTVYAKRWEPYQFPHQSKLQMLGRLKAVLELPYVYPVLAVVVLTAFLLYRDRAKPAAFATQQILFLGCMFAGALGFCVLFGHNPGHPGRMYLFFLPLLVLLGICLLEAVRLPEQAGASQMLMALVIGQIAWWCIPSVAFVRHGDAVPISVIAHEGTSIDRMRRDLQMPSARAFIPDVGGSSLCCDALDIYDAALLTNPVLSHTGEGPAPAYVRGINPDFIEISGEWATLTKTYESGILRNYDIVGVDQERIFVRSDLYTRLKKMYGPEVPVDAGPNCRGSWDRFERVDLEVSRQHGVCLVIPDKL